MEADYTYYPIIGASFVFFFLSYKFISPKLSEKYFPGYKLLNDVKQIDWNTRTISSVHAILVSFICVFALLTEEKLSADPIWGHSVVVKTNCAIVIGYMLSDTSVMLFHYRKVGDIGYISHHLAACWAFYYVVTHGCLAWFANFRLIAEFSTVFVNQRWFLDVLGYSKTSTLFMANGVVMSAMFFVVRVIPIPSYWSKVYSIYGTQPANDLGFMFWVMVATCAVLDTLNTLWSWKIFRGARKILRQAHDENKNFKAKAA